MRSHPHLYEINTSFFLKRLSSKYAKPLTLKTIPDTEWKYFSDLGFDFIWLMGVWQRSPVSRREAIGSQNLRSLYSKILPGWKDEDITGSPYAVYDYKLEPAFGSPDDLPGLKEKLNRMGLKLILDFVPNHFAVDHPWTIEHPQRFVRAPEEKTREYPDWFFKTSQGNYLAHGRDPYFPPWSDTVQVNFFSMEMREALRQNLLSVSEMADGLRCDMAMLGMNRIFQKVWGKFLKETPELLDEFWPQAIEKVKSKKPDFVFMAEAYWNTEWELQQMGFDFTYDKTLYDRLLHSSADNVAGHLQAEPDYQNHLARFIENHDEARAASAFGLERSMAAAVVTATTPGLRFFYDGQLEGRKIKIPIQLSREPEEKAQTIAQDFYKQFLKIINQSILHEGEWALLSRASVEDESFKNVLAWNWQLGEHYKIIVVNDSAESAKVSLSLPAPLQKVQWKEEFSARVVSFEKNKEEGIIVSLGPWGFYFLTSGEKS